eukprot:366133-Chlamydomonas_euryale.AAC.2
MCSVLAAECTGSPPSAPPHSSSPLALGLSLHDVLAPTPTTPDCVLRLCAQYHRAAGNTADDEADILEAKLDAIVRGALSAACDGAEPPLPPEELHSELSALTGAAQRLAGPGGAPAHGGVLRLVLNSLERLHGERLDSEGDGDGDDDDAEDTTGLDDDDVGSGQVPYVPLCGCREEQGGKAGGEGRKGKRQAAVRSAGRGGGRRGEQGGEASGNESTWGRLAGEE